MLTLGTDTDGCSSPHSGYPNFRPGFLQWRNSLLTVSSTSIPRLLRAVARTKPSHAQALMSFITSSITTQSYLELFEHWVLIIIIKWFGLSRPSPTSTTRMTSYSRISQYWYTAIFSSPHFGSFISYRLICPTLGINQKSKNINCYLHNGHPPFSGCASVNAE